MSRRILCHDCRLYFQKYGCLMPLTGKVVCNSGEVGGDDGTVLKVYTYH